MKRSFLLVNQWIIPSNLFFCLKQKSKIFLDKSDLLKDEKLARFMRQSFLMIFQQNFSFLLDILVFYSTKHIELRFFYNCVAGPHAFSDRGAWFWGRVSYLWGLLGRVSLGNGTNVEWSSTRCSQRRFWRTYLAHPKGCLYWFF